MQRRRMRAEHAVEMFRLRGGGAFGDDVNARQHLPTAQLAILPGTSHVTLVDDETGIPVPAEDSGTAGSWAGYRPVVQPVEPRRSRALS